MNKIRKKFAALLVLSLLVTFFPTRNIVGAGILEISNPVIKNGITTWDCIWFGEFFQDDVYGTKKEPVKWRVLSINGNDAFLIADSVLEVQSYHNEYVGANYDTQSITWETSSLRSCLNTVFLEEAFTAEEQSAIMSTQVQNKGNQKSGVSGGNTTNDKVYILSLGEWNNSAYGLTGSTWPATAFAGTTSGLWLRTSGDSESQVLTLSSEGTTYSLQPGPWVYGQFNTRGIRPVIHLNLSKTSAWTPAGTVSSDNTIKETDPSGIVRQTPPPVSVEDTVRLTNPTEGEFGMTWDCIWFGNYYTDDQFGIQKQPVKWRILSINGNDAFVISDKILFYNYSLGRWSQNLMEQTFNSQFINYAFTEHNLEQIKESTITTSDSDGNLLTTQNKLYLPSYTEVSNPDYGFADNYSRIAYTTAYASKSNPAIKSNSETARWNLRWYGPEDNLYEGKSGEELDGWGHLSVISGFPIPYRCGTRPVMHIDLSDTDQWSYAGTVAVKGNYTDEKAPGTVKGIVSSPAILYYGDIDQNELVDLTDAYLALKASLNIISLDDMQKAMADCDKDNSITLSDAHIVLNMALGINELIEFRTE